MHVLNIKDGRTTAILRHIDIAESSVHTRPDKTRKNNRADRKCCTGLRINYPSVAYTYLIQLVCNRSAREVQMLERRNFLTALSATILTAGLPAGIAAATQRQRGRSGSLRAQFARLVGSNFRLLNSTGVAQQARLVAVDDGPRCPGLEQFSIVFEGSDLAEGLYQVRSWRTGKMLVSLQPSGEPGTARNRQRRNGGRFTGMTFKR